MIDTKLNTTQDLRIKPTCELTLNAGNTEGRFFIKFSKLTNQGITADNNMFYLYSSDKMVNVIYNNTLNKEASLDVLNLLGQKVSETKYIQNGTSSFKLQTGVYIVRLKADGKTYNRKVVIE